MLHCLEVCTRKWLCWLDKPLLIVTSVNKERRARSKPGSLETPTGIARTERDCGDRDKEHSRRRSVNGFGARRVALERLIALRDAHKGVGGPHGRDVG